jgi:predicted GTPase
MFSLLFLINFLQSRNSIVDALGMGQSLRAIQFANVALLLVDISDPDRRLGLSKREILLAKHVLDNGRCLVIVANKMDRIASSEQEGHVLALRKATEGCLPQTPGTRWVRWFLQQHQSFR